MPKSFEIAENFLEKINERKQFRAKFSATVFARAHVLHRLIETSDYGPMYGQPPP